MSKERGIIAAISDLRVQLRGESAPILPVAVLKQVFEEMGKYPINLIAGDFIQNCISADQKIINDQLDRVIEILKQNKSTKIAVLGDHDKYGGNAEEVIRILKEEAKVKFLMGEAKKGTTIIKIPKTHRQKEVCIGIAGTSGYGWGQQIFPWDVLDYTAIEKQQSRRERQLQKLEEAIRVLQENESVDWIVVMVHFAGLSSYSDSPPALDILLDRNPKKIIGCVTGHMHTKVIEGKTLGGVPLYNVAIPSLKLAHTRDEHHPTEMFKVISLPRSHTYE